MTILSKFIVGACVFGFVAQAVPITLTVTDLVTVTTWETVYGTTTVYETGSQLSTANSTSSTTTTTVAVASTSSSTTPIAPVEQAPTTSTTAVPFTTPAVFVQQTTAATTAAVVQAAVTNYNPPQPATTLSTSTVAAPRFAQAPAASAAVGGPCQGAGSSCTGDVTHWDGGLGACGWNVNTNSDMQVALPVGLMGSQSNGNPYCGQSISIVSTSGAIIKATVGDKCMGCSGDSIDLTNALFSAVTDGKGDGRVSGIKWYFG